MEITRVTVEKVENVNPRMKGKASVELDRAFAIENIRVLEKSDGTLFIAMPSKQLPNGKFKDMCHPINAETREMFEKAIFAKYNEIKDTSDNETKEDE